MAKLTLAIQLDGTTMHQIQLGNNMNTLGFIVISSALFLSACGKSAQDSENTQAAVAEHHYRCESGEAVSASYPSTEAAIIQYKGHSYRMQITISGSGARYVGGGLEWWSKGTGAGSEGSVFFHNADGTSGDAIEFCTEL